MRRLNDHHSRLVVRQAILLRLSWPEPTLLPSVLLAHLLENHEPLYRRLCDLARDPLEALESHLPAELGGRGAVEPRSAHTKGRARPEPQIERA